MQISKPDKSKFYNLITPQISLEHKKLSGFTLRQF